MKLREYLGRGGELKAEDSWSRTCFSLSVAGKITGIFRCLARDSYVNHFSLYFLRGGTSYCLPRDSDGGHSGDSGGGGGGGGGGDGGGGGRGNCRACVRA